MTNFGDLNRPNRRPNAAHRHYVTARNSLFLAAKLKKRGPTVGRAGGYKRVGKGLALTSGGVEGYRDTFRRRARLMSGQTARRDIVGRECIFNPPARGRAGSPCAPLGRRPSSGRSCVDPSSPPQPLISMLRDEGVVILIRIRRVDAINFLKLAGAKSLRGIQAPNAFQ